MDITGKYTGIVYTTKQVELSGEAFWSYQDDRGYGPSLGWSSNRHATEADAVARIEMADWVAAAEGDRSPLTQAAYEAEAKRLGIETVEITDREYGIRYGVFSMPEYTAEMCAKMALAFRRLKAMDQEKIAAQVEQITIEEEAAIDAVSQPKAEVLRKVLPTAINVGRTMLIDGWLYRVVEAKKFQIDEDSPSVYGSEFLGEEGGYGSHATFEACTREETIAAIRLRFQLRRQNVSQAAT